ncbi:lipoprotein releasing system, ATP-binding protein [Psychromonas sp. CNPT3]|uniref:lipoprotein-releasing ABC transporter ATP-binding protein LolD n=1 Tax=Psychromonas sp. CNPT3 TaxID=314282 RepID=UPI0002C052B2|nr:lipoprotein-releasing ABC transporter ATP-binding protein LolD [Psychromonas sp. CNPT3]AGH81286.1 lipoprotein releasing system, ATP-binding protein [Psychromonas sp. CNPT3]
MSEELLVCKGLFKTYEDGSFSSQVLKGVDLSVKQGELLAIVGSSGSGKSTLLHLLGALDKPSQGDVYYQGQNIHHWKDNKQAKWRNQQLGFIYQFHHLLSEFSALENVAMPLLIAGMSIKEATQKSQDMLHRVGLEARVNYRPAKLSGGERQRVAIARALINDPQLVLADEPTGNLDALSAESVYQLLRSLNAELGTAFVVVTHDLALANKLDRVELMVNGILQGKRDV